MFGQIFDYFGKFLSRYSAKYYKNDFPNIDDFVYGTIIDINEYGISINLIEYNKIGYLSLKDASNKKKFIRIKQELKTGKDYVFSVNNLDKEKDEINLTKKYQTKEDEEVFLQFIKKYKKCLEIISKFFILKNLINEKEQLEYMDDIIWKYVLFFVP